MDSGPGCAPSRNDGVQNFETLLANADTKPFTADTLSDEVAFWFYTSGSTGDPKGVKHVHSNLMATAKFVLKMLPGIDRPAIIAELPAIGGTVHMLDLGANTSSDPQQLYQFAVMGSIVTGDIRHIEHPRVALLNIGVEDTKGHDTVRDAAALLAASGLNYVGFIEGNEIFSGKADVVVADGFTGNVALKTMEGTVGLASHYLRRAFTRNFFARMQAVLASPVLKRLRVEMDSRKYNGASLVGLNGIVIKSHGGADAYAFQHAIDTALVEVRNQVPAQIGNFLQREAA